MVAITCDQRALGPTHPPPGKVRLPKPEVFVSEFVVRRVREAGGIALLLPPGDPEGARDILDKVDALVVTGGAFDIHPSHYGQGVTARLDRVDEERTGLELLLCRVAATRGLPTLGLCGGMQAMVVALGGTLIQHVDGHEQDTDPAEAWHALRIAGGAPAELAALIAPDSNSTHHQAAGSLGELSLLASAPDGVVEAIFLASHPFFLGAQGHPELRSGVLFDGLLAAVARGTR